MFFNAIKRHRERSAEIQKVSHGLWWRVLDCRVASAPRSDGFTLIELSIVLVIIGLIIGGVLVGQDLIRAAGLRAVVSEQEKFKTAVMTFKLKYNALPGDMPNAKQFWGAHTNGSGSNPVTSTPQQGTFNGDGNRQVTPISNPSPGVFAHQETGAFWQHLANAGLIVGLYNGSNQYQGDSVNAFSNLSWPSDLSSPKTRLAGGAWWSAKYAGSGWLGYTGMSPGHIYLLSSAGSACYPTFAGAGEVLTAVEMQSMDSKIDDSAPNTGKILVANSNGSQSGSGCYFVTGTPCIVQSATLWNYNIAAGDKKICAPVFRAEF